MFNLIAVATIALALAPIVASVLAEMFEAA